MIYYIRNSKIEKAVQSYKKNIFSSIPPPVHHYDFYFLLTLTTYIFKIVKFFIVFLLSYGKTFSCRTVGKTGVIGTSDNSRFTTPTAIRQYYFLFISYPIFLKAATKSS